MYRHRLLLFTLLAIGVDYIPYVRLPFVWSETFFHELSHGLAALLSGGAIRSITLHVDGSGFCVSQGGVRVVVSFAGYFGSVVWGSLLTLAAAVINPRLAHAMMALLIGLLLLVMLLWADGLSTYLILSVMTGVFAVFLKYSDARGMKSFLQFVGVFVLLDAIRSPLVLIDGEARGDGATLAQITALPEMLWIGLWFAWGLAALIGLYRMSYLRSSRYGWA